MHNWNNLETAGLAERLDALHQRDGQWAEHGAIAGNVAGGDWPGCSRVTGQHPGAGEAPGGPRTHWSARTNRRTRRPPGAHAAAWDLHTQARPSLEAPTPAPPAPLSGHRYRCGARRSPRLLTSASFHRNHLHSELSANKKQRLGSLTLGAPPAVVTNPESPASRRAAAASPGLGTRLGARGEPGGLALRSGRAGCAAPGRARG